VSGPSTERPLRVLHVVHDYHPVIGGSELLFRKIAEGLVARGIEVSVLTSTARSTSDFIASKSDNFPAGKEAINGVVVERLRMRQFSPPVRRRLNALSHLWSTKQWRGYGYLKSFWVGPHLPGLVSKAVQYRPDLIAATAAPFLPIFDAAAAARQANCPVAVMPCLHPGDRWMIDNPSLLDLLRRINGVMTLTPYERDLLRALDVPADRIWIIGGGVDVNAPKTARRDLRAQFNIADDEPIVLFCGRKEEGKGVQQVLEAMVRLWQQDRPGTLVLAGSATDFSRTHLARMIDRLPPEWRVRLVSRDNIDEAEKWGWYQACDVLAHPSHVESFGLVYLEAWLCGRAVIGGRTGPQAALIADGEDGFVVKPGHVEELAQRLGALLADRRGLSAALGRRGQAKVMERYTWDAVVDRAEQMYRTLVERHAHAAH
jgi:glycosyltransferase involved in cell wall biosynthesis